MKLANLVIFTAGVLWFLLIAAPVQAQDLLKVYPAPPGEPLSDLFKVSVEGHPAAVYLATVGSLTGPNLKEELMGKASFTSFDISGPVKVIVTYAQPVQEAKMLPSRLNIPLTVTGSQVSFVISSPGQLTLEINGDWNNSLHLFANPFETNIPDPNDPNVVYFGPGVHRVQKVQVNSGQTVYVAGGAVVYARFVPGVTKGSIIKYNGSNITIRGRGIIDASDIPKEYNGKHMGTDLIAGHGTNIQVEGIILRDSGSWNLHIDQSQNVTVSNIKVFGWRLNSDGTDIDNSQNVVVSNSFYRTYDDLVVVKTHHLAGESSNITVKGCVLWNEKAHALTLGTELKDNVDGVVFTDCDIIHDKGHDTLLAILDDYQGQVHNVSFDNLHVEESMWLINLSIRETKKSVDSDRGQIDTVNFKNIVAPVPSRQGSSIILNGYGPSNEINNVSFDNVTIGSAKLQTDDIERNSYVKDVQITRS